MWEHLLFSGNPRSQRVKNWNMTRKTRTYNIETISFKGSKTYNYAALTRDAEHYPVTQYALIWIDMVGAPSGGRNWNFGQQFTTEIRTAKPIKQTLVNALELNNPRYQHMTHATLGLSYATNELGEQTYTMVSCNLSNKGKHKFETLSVRSVSFRLNATVRDAV